MFDVLNSSDVEKKLRTKIMTKTIEKFLEEESKAEKPHTYAQIATMIMGKMVALEEMSMEQLVDML